MQTSAPASSTFSAPHQSGSVPGAVRIRASAADGWTDVKVLIPHPMETGLRKDEQGNFVPAHYITDVRVTVSGRMVLQAKMSLAVSRDPLLAFRFRGGQPGERVAVSWTDNRGRQGVDDAAIV